jgi:alkylated DNA repair protein alkB family protein 1
MFERASVHCPALRPPPSAWCAQDVPPLPLMLRSGDAVVLSGPARRCYHGVPRIFPDTAPAALCRRDPDDPFHPFAQHMGGCRINISIRATR